METPGVGAGPPAGGSRGGKAGRKGGEAARWFICVLPLGQGCASSALR